MPSPFPGMDPFWKTRLLWPDVHHDFDHGNQGGHQSTSTAELLARGEQGAACIFRMTTRSRPTRHCARRSSCRKSVKLGDLRTSASVSFQASEVVDVSEPIVVTTILDEQVEEAYLEIIDRQYRQVVTVIEVVSPTNKVSGARGLESYRRRSEVRFWHRPVILLRSTCCVTVRR